MLAALCSQPDPHLLRSLVDSAEYHLRQFRTGETADTATSLVEQPTTRILPRSNPAMSKSSLAVRYASPLIIVISSVICSPPYDFS